LSEQERRLVWATQSVPAADLFNVKVGGTAWRSKPTWYIVAKNDRTVHPDLERFVAKRMGATTKEVASSHVPMLSHPDVVKPALGSGENGRSDPLVPYGIGEEAMPIDLDQNCRVAKPGHPQPREWGCREARWLDRSGTRPRPRLHVGVGPEMG
jgi:hypothetical protein